MGLRCLLGHDFTEPTTEREREERGDEVIVAVRRVKECKRCGERRVVSENKEVTSLDGPLGATDPDAESADASARASGAIDDGVAASAGGGWADGADRGNPLVESDDGGDEFDGDEFDHPEADLDGVDTDVEDDAEIIRSGPDDADTPDDAAGRGRGEWPDADVNSSTGAVGRTTAGDEPAAGDATEDAPSADDDGTWGADDGTDDRTTTDPADEDAEFIDADAGSDGPADGTGDDDERVSWPDHDGADEGFDATFGGDDGSDGSPETAAEATDDDPGGEYIEAESEPLDGAEPVGSTGVGDTGGSWGATATNGTDRSERSERSDRSERSNGSDGGSGSPAVELQTVSGDPDAEYVCPECGEREPVGASSTRAGDICPDCKRGYIEERELE